MENIFSLYNSYFSSMRWYLKILLFLFPVAVLFTTNTLTTYDKTAHYVSDKLNPLDRMHNKCSWACHNNTDHCKKNHVKLISNYYEYTDPIYFGIINLMGTKDYYAIMNVLILAFLIPIIMFILLIRIIDLQLKIRQLKK